MLTEPVLLTVTVSVHDRGPAFGGERFVAELEDLSVVRGSGASAWEAIRELISSHRALLERRWSEGGQLVLRVDERREALQRESLEEASHHRRPEHRSDGLRALVQLRA